MNQNKAGLSMEVNDLAQGHYAHGKSFLIQGRSVDLRWLIKGQW